MEKNYFSGIVGGIIGGILCSVPWLVAYVGFDMLISVLALIIGIGVLKGYQLLNGKVTKALPVLVAIISIAIVTLETLVLIPMLLAYKEGYSFDISILKVFYADSEFKTGMLKDLAMSLLFTVLGISSVVASVKVQLSQNDIDDDYEVTYGGEKNTKSQQKRIKNFFAEHNAYSEETSIVVDYTSGLDQATFLDMQRRGIIVAVDGKYYYSHEGARVAPPIEKEVSNSSRKRAVVIACIAAGLIVVIGIAYAMFFGNNTSANGSGTLKFGKNHSVKLEDDYYYYADEEYENVYYVYNVNDIDDSGSFTNVIEITYETDLDFSYSDSDLDDYISSFEDYEDVTIVSSKNTYTESGLHLAELVLHLVGEDEEGTYDYYDIIKVIYSESDAMFFVQVFGDTLNNAQNLFDNSGISQSIK